MSNNPLVCQLGMAGVNFKHNRVDLCYRSISGTTKKHTSIAEAVNDEELCSQRLQLLNGNWPSACFDCMYMEKQGAESYRQRIKFYPNKSDQFYLDNVDPVTGKVKPGSKAAKRRKSFCARSAGQMKKFPKAAKDPNSRLRQARKRWKC